MSRPGDVGFRLEPIGVAMASPDEIDPIRD